MKMFVVAGEKSGDKQGALVMQELLRRRPDLEIVGLGGNRMHALAPGVEDWAWTDHQRTRTGRTVTAQC